MPVREVDNLSAIPYGRQEITQEDIDEVVSVLKGDSLTQGPRVAEFEERFAEYVGAKYALAVSNGTAALHLSCLALGVNRDSVVVTSPITFVASANCVRYCDGSVQFVDVDPNTATLSISLLEKLLERNPHGISGVVAVDFAGHAVDLEALSHLAKRHKFWILEDACHAPGGFFLDSNSVKQMCGNGQFADLSIFSFHPVKHIACGEGGMITTNRPDLYETLKILRTHGIIKEDQHLTKCDGAWYYEMQSLGFNYRITDFQCALGTSQLKREPQRLKRRREIARQYNEAFASLPIRPLASEEGHAFHLYVIRTKKRRELYEHLRSYKIYSQVHYIPVHLQPYYQSLGFKAGDFPEAEAFYEECLSLPMYPTLTANEQQRVIDAVTEFFSTGTEEE
jgi:UDP-4-amino-4,6-dideoxy-N-acetyl-beta-L-altrosamine transaminase